jgi:hypothetical protein
MRTLIASDLHLGSTSGSDVLRRAPLRAALLDALVDVDRLVLLGDVLELRHGPMREAIAAARPFFEDLGRVLGDRELVIVAGNHDHGLVEPWLSHRGDIDKPEPLEVQQLLEPAQASPALSYVAELAAPARVVVAYPGLWVRPDVYATHGHYLDCHLTVPTLERLSVGAMSRLLRRPASGFDSVGDYEAMSAPVFAWRDAVARDAHTGAALNGLATVTAWQALRGGADRPKSLMGAKRWLRSHAIAAGFPLVVATLNRAGLGPISANVSAAELRRAGLAAMGEVAARLRLSDAHVVFGHTHRTGPLDGDDPAEWRGRGGARLVNCGSWTYAPIFFGGEPNESPYWPGACVVVDDDGPPQIRRLLSAQTPAELRPVRV